jgi:hypothetical protein
MNLPILHIRRSEGDAALAAHRLTSDEQRVFRVLDALTGQLPGDAEQSAYHRTVAEAGAAFGLSPGQSVAFWTRTTFRVFEAGVRA